MNWRSCYIDHYQRLFGQPQETRFFEGVQGAPPIEILQFDNVLPRCRVFASLGLANYREKIGRVAEVVVPVDEGFDVVPVAVANVLFHMIQHQMSMGWGLSVRGLDMAVPGFSQRFGKTSLYWTTPYGFTPDAEKVPCGGESGGLFLGIFISDEEHRFFQQQGAEEFEELLTAAQVDPYVLRRPSCTSRSLH